MEQQHDLLRQNPEAEQPEISLDEEDQEALLCDCHSFLERVLSRSNPKWLQDDGLKLLDRLAEVLSWYKIH